MTTRPALALLLALTFPLAAAPLQVRDTRIATWEPTGVTIVKGTVDVPRNAQLDWPLLEGGVLAEIFIPLDEGYENRLEGERFARLEDRKEIKKRRWEVWRVLRACQDHARNNGGIGPATLAQAGIANKDMYLVPEVRIYNRDEKNDLWVNAGNGETLLIDLAPSIADGEHYVAKTGNQVTRVPIDEDRMKKLGVVVTPQAPAFADRLARQEKTYPRTIYARLTGEPGTVTIPTRDFYSGKPLPIEWNLEEARPGNPKQCQDWALNRAWLHASNTKPEAVVARAWISRTFEQYRLGELGEDLSMFFDEPERRGRPGNATSMMGILGGRAAIEETLQLRNLRLSTEEAGDWDPTVPIAEIKGVEVEAHPFEEMLEGRKGGRLALADWTPHDRFFLHVAQPDKIFSLLDGGSDFLHKAGSGLTNRSVSHGIKQRYLDDFGMSETLLRRFLDTGAIEEMALFLPDLHLIDGTEMTAVLRTGRPLLANAALALVGVPPGDGRTVRKTPSGRTVHWERRGDIVVVSTSEAELEAALAAQAAKTGLGQSAEFRYMLTQLPIIEGTVLYTYLSDPFIRKLVGPAAKIGQFRRLLARSELEEGTAGALLARFDGRDAEAADLEALRKLGYVRRPAFVSDLVLHDDGGALSERFGSPPRMNSLQELPLDRVSPKEQEAYETYRNRYNQYWRRFFDPIAIRYLQDDEGGHAVETFILPLIDNSIYEGLRTVLPAADETPALQVPDIEPDPVAVLSWNLREEALLNALEGVRDEFEELLNLDPRLLDLLSNDMHLALADADPIITIGGGELDGLFGSFGSDADEMLAISTFVSILTRPCTLHIGLTDPDEARKLLGTMSWELLGDGEWSNFGKGSLYKVSGRDQWIYRYTIEDVITLRFGIEIQDRYLIINNQPFSHPVRVTGHFAADQGAARLALHPSACKRQLPALFASMAEQQRHNALASASALQPLVLLEDGDVEAAAGLHRKLFGFAPTHPVGGSFTFDRYEAVGSTLFGSQYNAEQPAFGPDVEGQGLLKGLSGAAVSMQFEQDGLRATARWKTE